MLNIMINTPKEKKMHMNDSASATNFNLDSTLLSSDGLYVR